MVEKVVMGFSCCMYDYSLGDMYTHRIINCPASMILFVFAGALLYIASEDRTANENWLGHAPLEDLAAQVRLEPVPCIHVSRLYYVILIFSYQ